MGNKTKQRLALSSILGGIALLITVLNDLQGAWNQIREIWSWFNTTVLSRLVEFLTIPIPLWGVALLTVILLLSIRRLYVWANSSTSLSSRSTQHSLASPAKFRDVWIRWHGVTGGAGIKVDEIRCGIDGCAESIVDTAKILDGVFLVCKDGHYVGNDLGYEYWKTQEAEFSKRLEAEAKLRKEKLQEQHDDFASQVVAGIKTQEEFDNWKRSLPAVSKVGHYTAPLPVDYVMQPLIADFIDEYKRKEFNREISNNNPH